MNIFLDRKPVLNEKQLERLSNIFDGAGQVIFGVAVVGPLLVGFDKINWIVLASAMLAVFGCWFLSVWFIRKGK